MAWLQQLFQAKNWERLEQVARDRLAANPADTETHWFLGWAVYQLDRPKEGLHHAGLVLAEDPEDEAGRHLAAVCCLDTRQFKEAWSHIDHLLRLDPDDATYHYLAAIHAARTNRLKEARAHIRQARVLAPEWASALEFEALLDGVDQHSASDAWRRIRKLEEALRLNPESGAALAGIGDIYLELEQPVKAQEQYRAALFLDPTNKTWQRDLLNAVRARSLFYRTLSLPATSLRLLRGWKTNFILLIFLLKPFVVFLVWLVFAGGLFYPASKIYEAIVLSAAMPPRTRSRWLRPFQAVGRWPLAVRMGLAIVVICGFWAALIWKLYAISPQKSLQFMIWMFGVHFCLVALWVGWKRLRTWSGRRRERHEWAKTPAGSASKAGLASHAPPH